MSELYDYKISKKEQAEAQVFFTTPEFKAISKAISEKHKSKLAKPAPRGNKE